MNITLASCFVNSTPYLPRYFAQVIALQDALQARGDRLLCLWGEGDSTDKTRSMLNGARFRINAELIDVTHGGEIFGSVAKAERFRQLAAVGRKIYAKIPKECDVFLWVESDLIWGVETALGLIDSVGQSVIFNPLAASSDRPANGDIQAVAPAIILDRPGWGEGCFYDTLAFMANGKRFQHQPPYHPANDGHSLLEMESVGSMVAMQAVYARQVVMDELVIMGVCMQIRERGGRVWYDPTLPPAIHK